MLLGDYNDVNSYYRNFAIVVLRREPIDVTMELISNLAPHIWTPIHKFYLDLVHQVQVIEAIHLY